MWTSVSPCMWVTAHAPRFGPGVSERFAGAAGVKRTDVAAAEETRGAIARRVAGAYTRSDFSST
jgi:hypothetical protein